ncbi:hypothetical protein MPN29_02415 [Riemerella anatipestifer]|nr:hypothetical protein [Riemerella anatipestifer]MDD1549311.1 hypothetical protein [Riemerella anatipestifer]MDR7832021.1 hypothetical protein [Riemerella anatipestifer]MDY3402903.1 hypothetical protein [Riemerella anatipestifer]OBP65140.1 hypothetical protein AWB84_01220 [Riemerella anatipestifer]QZO83697.1 hypothetical protein K6T40_02410 [Riemerella anatipestifer]
MKKIDSFDIVIGGYKEHKDTIIKTYPKQYVCLKKVTSPNGYVDIEVNSIYGKIGYIYSDNSKEILPYLKDDQYYIESFIKKTYPKDRIYEAVVLVVNVYMKSPNFTEPKHEFLGNFVSNYDKYDYGYMMTDDDEIKCSISKQNQEIVDNIEDYDNAKLVVNNDIIDVYFFSDLVGHISKKTSERIIPYLKDENKDVMSIFRISESNTTFEKKARLEIEIKEKKYLEHSKYIQDKSLLINGVQVVRKERKGNRINFYAVENIDSDIVDEELLKKRELRRTQLKERKRIERQKERRGCLIFLVLIFIIYGLYRAYPLFFKKEKYYIIIEEKDYTFREYGVDEEKIDSIENNDLKEVYKEAFTKYRISAELDKAFTSDVLNMETTGFRIIKQSTNEDVTKLLPKNVRDSIESIVLKNTQNISERYKTPN